MRPCARKPRPRPEPQTYGCAGPRRRARRPRPVSSSSADRMAMQSAASRIKASRLIVSAAVYAARMLRYRCGEIVEVGGDRVDHWTDFWPARALPHRFNEWDDHVVLARGCLADVLRSVDVDRLLFDELVRNLVPEAPTVAIPQWNAARSTASSADRWRGSRGPIAASIVTASASSSANTSLTSAHEGQRCQVGGDRGAGTAVSLARAALRSALRLHHCSEADGRPKVTIERCLSARAGASTKRQLSSASHGTISAEATTTGATPSWCRPRVTSVCCTGNP